MIAHGVNLSLRPLKLDCGVRPLMLVGHGRTVRDEELDEFGASAALALFRSGLDNVDIAWRLECTPAAAANGIASAREQERKRAA
ncbi:MAG: hypothetical protein C0458_05570 [Methylobacterium sp.]|nr:hypothetical protein [Methylobacterium sp.]